MAYPRHHTVPPGVPGTYHCISRCVRRAFLCGNDPVTGRSFEHRKQWLEDRILELGNLFAVAVHAYAVMSNHLHVVLHVDPQAVDDWSNEEVARRWLALCPPRGMDGPSLQSRIRELATQSERIAVLRERLGSVSWFNRFLKEPIARTANREDECTGRFWEGRFATQNALNDPALLTCMVYVDLNPVRAGISANPQDGPHTSLRRRLAFESDLQVSLQPLAASIRCELPELSLHAYLDLVNWTHSNLHADDKAPMTDSVPHTLQQLNMRPKHWLLQVPAIETHFSRAIGTSNALLELAEKLGQRWVRGIGTARAFEKVPDTS